MKLQNSFTKEVKEEIVSNTYSKERLLAILSAFTRVNASLVMRNKNDYIVYRIENSKIAKFIYGIINKLFKITPSISYLKKTNLYKNTCYLISVPNKNILDKLHIDFLEDKIDKSFSKTSESLGGYIAGVFLASGSVNSPRNSNYHLEVSFNNKNFANQFIKLIKKYKEVNFVGKIIKRREKYVVYIKRSDWISDFLILIGATDATLYYESIRVDRDVSNYSNRQANLDTANYAKTVKSAKKDITIINKLIKKFGLANLGSEKVITLASLRVKHPEASLEELASLLSKELREDITKSNVNHILRALREEGKNL